MMIRHIVMWRVAHSTEEDRAAVCLKIAAVFEGLAGRIPGLRSIEVGIDISRVDYASDVVLVSEFDDRAALTAYAVHPEHLQVRAELSGLRIEARQVDYEHN